MSSKLAIDTERERRMGSPLRPRIPPVDPVILSVLGDPLPEAEKALWRAMSPKQRDQAVGRVAAFERWRKDPEWKAAEAAAAAGLKLNRFYTLAKAWADARTHSLAMTGLAAMKTSTRRSRYDEAASTLEAVIDDLIVQTPGASTLSLIAAVGEDERAKGLKLPGDRTLGKLIDERKRRQGSKKLIGEEIVIDCCACSLRDMEGDAHVIFACLDKATGLVLGFTVEGSHRTLPGCSGAALSAWNAIDEGHWTDLPWAESTKQIRIAVDADEEWKPVLAGLQKNKAEIDVFPRTSPRWYGREFVEVVGRSFGRVKLLPAQTMAIKPPAVSTSSELFQHYEAVLRLEEDVSAYNKSILDTLERSVGGNAPSGLSDLLLSLGGADFSWDY